MWSFGLQTVEIAEEGDEDDDQVPHQGRHSSRLESRAAVHATKSSWNIKSRPGLDGKSWKNEENITLVLKRA